MLQMDLQAIARDSFSPESILAEFVSGALLGCRCGLIVQRGSFGIMCIERRCLAASQARSDKEDSEQRKVDAAAFWVEALSHQLHLKKRSLSLDRAI